MVPHLCESAISGAAAVLVFALSPLQLCLNGFFDRLLCWLLDFRRLQAPLL